MAPRVPPLLRPGLLLAALALTACGTHSSSSGAAEAPPAEQLAQLRADIEALAQRPEVEAERIDVIHVLIGYEGAPRMNVRRSAEEAEALAARVYDLALKGDSMLNLKREFSEDSGGGVYGMVQSGQGKPGDTPRANMVPAFGNVGWRLQVGEIGVAPLHPADSPYGWHIIQRTE